MNFTTSKISLSSRTTEPKGKYFVSLDVGYAELFSSDGLAIIVGNHVVCVENGDYYDTWDSVEAKKGDTFVIDTNDFKTSKTLRQTYADFYHAIKFW